MMRRRAGLAWAAAVSAAGSPVATASTPAPPQKGQPVAWPEVPLLGGGRFSASEAAGHAVVVVFWSTTCPFCRRHNEHVTKLTQAAQAAPGKRLKVLTVARDRDAALVARTAQQRGYAFPITVEYAAVAAAISQRNIIPLTATVDRQGRLLQVYPGEMFEEDVMEFLGLAG
jgi:thiol-disulfide isomerase/thioredoxin